MFNYIFLEGITVTFGTLTITASGVILAFVVFAWQVGRARKSDLKEIMNSKTDRTIFDAHVEKNQMEYDGIKEKIDESKNSIEKLTDGIENSNRDIFKKLDDHQKQIIDILKKNGKK